MSSFKFVKAATRCAALLVILNFVISSYARAADIVSDDPGESRYIKVTQNTVNRTVFEVCSTANDKCNYIGYPNGYTYEQLRTIQTSLRHKADLAAAGTAAVGAAAFVGLVALAVTTDGAGLLVVGFFGATFEGPAAVVATAEVATKVNEFRIEMLSDGMNSTRSLMVTESMSQVINALSADLN